MNIIGKYVAKINEVLINSPLVVKLLKYLAIHKNKNTNAKTILFLKG